MVDQDQILLFSPPKDRLAEYARWATHSRLLADKTVQDRLVILRQALRSERSWFPEGVETATRRQIQNYVDTLRNTAATRNAARLAFLSYYQFIKESGQRDDNPAEALPTWKPNECVPRPLTAPQAQLLLQTANVISPKVGCLISGYLYAGLRLSEWANRRWSDLSEDQVYFVAKGNRRQVRYMNPPLRTAVDRWRRERESKVLMFPSTHCPTIPVSRKWVYKTVMELGDVAGIDGCNPHRLRHTFAQKLYDDTGNIHLVQVALGHSNIQNTLKYARHSRRGIEESLQELLY
jgi:integrase/recombinase XerD